MYIKNEYTFKIGDRDITTVELQSCAGTFTVGTIVTVTGISWRGYDLQDEFGNEMIECGFGCLKKI